MTDYKTVADALAGGTDPEMLCMTCPWDRFCITPPSMTKDEVDRQINDAKVKDDEKVAASKAEGNNPGMPVGMLLMTLTLAGKDTSCQVCPVFALRLRTSFGGEIVRSIRNTMQEAGVDAR